MIRALITTTLIAGSLLVGTAGCNPYDPELGAAPFKCAAQEPRCPDGYTCEALSADYQVCKAGSGGNTTPDSNTGIVCNDDKALEPNESVLDAKPIPARTLGTPFAYKAVAICPASDKDFFKFVVEANTTNVEVVVDFSTGPALTMQVLNSNNVPIASGEVAGNRSRAYVANAAAGTYYISISGTGNNNYDLTVTQSR